VNRICLKAPRWRLNAEKYDQLRQGVLWRDGWRCQFCGTMSNLEVHHKEFRSLSGQDIEQNLITLCRACHSRVHEARISYDDQFTNIRKLSTTGGSASC